MQSASLYQTDQSKVYLSYAEPLPHPGNAWTRFICISDTHSGTYPVPVGDVLLHSGDLSGRGTLAQLQVTFDWLKTLPHPVKIIIAGNHDLCLDAACHSLTKHGITEKDITIAKSLLQGPVARHAGIHYLDQEAVQITIKDRTWKIYGSPATPHYSNGAFQYYSTKEGEVIYSHIPSTAEILLTHPPPYRVLDLTKRGKHAGCRALATRVEALQHCRLHVFGHIHEAHGAAIAAGATDGALERVSVNAAIHRGEQAVIVDLRN